MTMKIKWVNPSHSFQPTTSNLTNTVKDYVTHVNPGYYILRSYYKYKSPENYHKLEWLAPHFHPISNDDIEDIISQKVDVLCLSYFVWNAGHLNRLAKRVKEESPNTLIIAGGPDLDAHKCSDFFERRPYIDYVVYGDGEVPFAEILDAYINNTEISPTATNLVTKEKVYPHKVFADNVFWGMSYVLDMKDEIKTDCDKILVFSKGIRLDWEIDRGCPYACSFCDWSSGLHHKVKRRSKSWKDEIDFLKTLPITVKLSNANFGIYEEDVKIAEYIRDNNIQNIKILYLAKLNKDRAWKIQDILAQGEGEYIAPVSLQDIDEEILNNIDRPSLPWEEERRYIIDFNKKYPDSLFYFDIMIGLPGQTLDTFKYLLMEIHNLNIKKTAFGNYHWHLLNNTPAYNKSYQEKFGMKFEEFFIPTLNEPNEYSNDISFEELTKLYNSGSSFTTKATVVKETYSANCLEIIKIMIMMGVYSGIKNTATNVNLSKIIFSPSFDRFLEDEASSTLRVMEKNRLWGKWCPVEKKWFSIDSYYYRYIITREIFKTYGYKYE